MTTGPPYELQFVAGPAGALALAACKPADVPMSERSGTDATGGTGLWSVYDESLKSAKYIDLTHTLTPSISR